MRTGFIIFLSLLSIGAVYYSRHRDKASEETSTKQENKTIMQKTANEKELPTIELTVVYDNNPYDNRLKTGWGFSCLVTTGDRYILFDTGADAETLLSNMRILDIDPKKIGIVVLSHIHEDHTGGLFGFLKENPGIKVFLPHSFPQGSKGEVKSFGGSVVEVSNSIQIADQIFSSGEMGILIREQALIVETGQGPVVVTGCAHPGIVDVVKKAKEITGEEVYLVIGGFHLSGASDSELKSIISDFRKLGVEKVGPCHCSGDRCRKLFKEEYGNGYIEIGVGKRITV